MAEYVEIIERGGPRAFRKPKRADRGTIRKTRGIRLSDYEIEQLDQIGAALSTSRNDTIATMARAVAAILEQPDGAARLHQLADTTPTGATSGAADRPV